MLEAVQNIKIDGFDYPLPDHRIAKKPLDNREDAKLLVANGNFEASNVRKIGHFLPVSTSLFLNETKVVHARLHFRKSTGGIVEIFCLEPLDHTDPQLAMLNRGMASWKCLVGGAKKWKDDPVILELGQTTVFAHKVKRLEDAFEIRFEWDSQHTFSEILSTAGELPLPPYMNRKATKADEQRYQTDFAKNEGSVAAPTAGLHFSKNLLADLESIGHQVHYLTLHVGAGTFKPVKSPTIQDHVMHYELIDVRLETIEKLLQNPGPIVPVGTTSLRTLESLYWFGVMAHNGKLGLQPELNQWAPYSGWENLQLHDSLKALQKHLIQNNLNRFLAKTQLMIAPGYEFKVASGLITNFHQPRSTLLLIIAALMGKQWKDMYQFALDNDFRFLSYGDCCLVLPGRVNA